MNEQKARELADLIVEIAEAVSKKNNAMDALDYDKVTGWAQWESDTWRKLVAKLQEV